jgi:erythromycin esterase
MKYRFSSFVTLFVGLFLVGKCNLTQAQVKGRSPDSAFVSWARTHAFSLANLDLKPVESISARARVVALGEPEHGTHEAPAFRNRRFRYLVEKAGFTAIALEADFARSRVADDYISGGPGSAEQAAKALSWGSPSADNVALVRWMRAYNQQAVHKVKIKLYGMDMELIGAPGDTTPSHTALDEALTYLKKMDRTAAARILQKLAPFINRLSAANYAGLSTAEHRLLSRSLDELIETLQQKQQAYTDASSESAYEWAYHNAIVARQTDQMVCLMPPEIPGKIPPDGWKAASARDSCMAENVLWMLRREQKLFVYAHDAHVKNAATKGGVWDVFQQPPNATGQYLRKALDDQLVIFGISLAPTFDIKQPGSLETALMSTGKSNFLINLRATGIDPETAQWLLMPRPMQMNSVTFMNLAVGTAFDVIVYLAKGPPD